MGIKDYIHYYIGQECQCFWRNEDGSKEYERTAKIVALDMEPGPDRNPVVIQYAIGREKKLFTRLHYAFEEVVLILRPLCSMTEDEALTVARFHVPEFCPTAKETESAIKKIREDGADALRFDDTRAQVVFNIVHYLLSRGFDLFNLIPAGLAIDSSTLTNNTKQ